MTCQLTTYLEASPSFDLQKIFSCTFCIENQCMRCNEFSLSLLQLSDKKQNLTMSIDDGKLQVFFNWCQVKRKIATCCLGLTIPAALSGAKVF